MDNFLLRNRQCDESMKWYINERDYENENKNLNKSSSGTKIIDSEIYQLQQ